MLKRLWARVTSVNIPLAAAALFAAAILHILATLATPHLIPTSGYGRLAGDLPASRIKESADRIRLLHQRFVRHADFAA